MPKKISGTQSYLNQSEDHRAPDTGKILDNALRKKGLPVAEIARRLDRNRSTISGYLYNPSIQTAVLWELCYALKRNFFADIAAQLPAHFESDALTAARAEIEALKAERDVLARVLREG